MQKIVIMAALSLMCLVFSAPDTNAAPGQQERPLRVLLTYGGHGFEEKEFYAMWGALPGIVYTKAELPAQADLLKPGLEKQYDVIVLYDMVNQLSAEQRRNYIELLKTGIGVVALHHSLCAQQDWPEYRKIIGGKWLGKPETIAGKEYPPSTFDHDQIIPVTIVDKEHAITKGLQDFTLEDETYGRYYVEPTSRVLLTTNHPKSGREVAWVTHYGKSPVFYLMFGHGPSGWKHPTYRELLLRGIHWAADADKKK